MSSPESSFPEKLVFDTPIKPCVIFRIDKAHMNQVITDNKTRVYVLTSGNEATESSSVKFYTEQRSRVMIDKDRHKPVLLDYADSIWHYGVIFCANNKYYAAFFVENNDSTKPNYASAAIIEIQDVDRRYRMQGLLQKKFDNKNALGVAIVNYFFKMNDTIRSITLELPENTNPDLKVVANTGGNGKTRTKRLNRRGIRRNNRSKRGFLKNQK